MKKIFIIITLIGFLFACGCAHKQKAMLPMPKNEAQRLAIIHEVLVATGKVVDLLDNETIPVEKRMEMYESLMNAINELLYSTKPRRY